MHFFYLINYESAAPFILDNTIFFNNSNNFISAVTGSLKLNERDVLVIQDSITDEGKYKYTQFYGIQLIKELRIKHQLCNAIILLSPITEANFYIAQKSEILFTPLLDPAVAIMPIDSSIINIQNTANTIYPLSKAGLEDATLSLYDLGGFIFNNLSHSLKWGLSLKAFEDGITEILIYVGEEKKRQIENKKYPQQLADAQNETIFFNTRTTCLNEITSIVNGNLSLSNKGLISEQTYLKILLIEDNEEELKAIVDTLAKRFIVYPFTKASDAVNYLENDITNEIVAVVSDWRLLQSGTNKRQNKQGYDVLEIASKLGCRSLYALTSLEDTKLIHGIRNMLNCKIYFIQKHYFFNDLLMQQTYLNEIESGCIAILNLSFPEIKSWKDRGLDKAYKEERMSLNWDKFNIELNNTFNTILFKIEKARGETNNLILICPLINYGGPELADHDLKTVLLYRKFFLYYNKLFIDIYKDETTRSNNIFTCLRGGSEIGLGFFMNQICLKRKNLLVNLLPEEKAWYHSLKIS
jgi:hypothetical protein